MRSLSSPSARMALRDSVALVGLVGFVPLLAFVPLVALAGCHATHSHALRHPLENSTSCATVSGVAPGTTVPSHLTASTETLVREGLKSRQSAALVASLTDSVGPRLSGSPGEKAAIAWAVQTLTTLGFDHVHTEPVDVPHWKRGVEQALALDPEQPGLSHPLAITALGGSSHTKPEGLEAPVLEVESLQALEKLDRKAVEGHIVFVNLPMQRSVDGSGYGQASPARWAGPALAASKGAVGFLLRSLGTDSSRFPHTGGTKSESGPSTIPSAALAVSDAERLHRMLLRRGGIKLRLTLTCETLEHVASYNVLGEVSPTKPSSEVVLLGAHLDSWDLGTGALDDGAGVGAVIEAAHLLRRTRVPLDRTVRVVLFANEENGLGGAKAYARDHTGELSSHVVAMEADSGTGRVQGFRMHGGGAAHPAFLQIAEALRHLGVAASHQSGDGGADISPLQKLGVPTIALAQDMTTYFDFHHTANDTFDKVDAEALAQVATAFAVTAFHAAQKTSSFARVPPGSPSGR